MAYQKLPTSDTLIDIQNGKLDTLYDSVRAVKQVATSLNSEIQSHEPLLDNLGDKVDNTNDNLQNKNKQIASLIKTKNGCCGMWIFYVIIALQIIGIIAIIASWF